MLGSEGAKGLDIGVAPSNGALSWRFISWTRKCGSNNAWDTEAAEEAKTELPSTDGGLLHLRCGEGASIQHDMMYALVPL